MSKKPTLKEIKKHYWACGDCMRQAGGVWPEGHVATVTHGECEVCGFDGTLIPWCDYNWPKENRQTNLAAKFGRD